jgi:Fe-S cluster assembly protein SufD
MNHFSDPHDAWLTLFAQFEKRAKMIEPPWLLTLRKKAFARLMELGFPTPAQEDWKYTRVDSITDTSFHRVEPVVDTVLPPVFGVLKKTHTHRLVFAGGHYLPAASHVEDLSSSITAGNLALQLGTLPEWLQPDPVESADAFSVLNAAFLEDGAFLNLPRNTVVEKPIHLVFLMPPSEVPSIAHPHNVIVVGESCHVTLIETYAGTDHCRYLHNTFTELMVGPNSTVRYYRLQLEGADGCHIGALKVHLGRSSVLDVTSVSLGGAIARVGWDVVLNGSGVECSLNGLSVTTGHQHVDNHLRVDHRQPCGISRELFKGIHDGRSTGVFDGRIIVQPNARKTDARQVNRNLLLSDDATADSKPHLEIHADDVKCTHGATVGQLDEEALFYLRSRGIAETDARNLLTMAFAREVLDRIPESPLTEMLESTLIERLTHAASERNASREIDPTVNPLPRSLPPASADCSRLPDTVSSPGTTHLLPPTQPVHQGARYDYRS